MDRRDAVKYISVLLGGTMVASSALMQGCRSSDTESSGLTFKDTDIPFLDEVSDTILPTTSTPGAKAAQVGKFMTVMVNDCYDKQDQEIFHKGMKQLNDLARKNYKTDFVKMAPDKKLEMLIGLDKEQKEYQKNKKPEERSHYFRMMKELTLLGYYTSEIGCTQAMRYMERPGKYEGCIPYVKGEKAWAI
jgi:hypothetical protein